MCIDVRRDRVLADTLREMSKPQFDYTKLLKVHVRDYNGMYGKISLVELPILKSTR